MDIATQDLQNVSSAVRLIALQFSFSNPDIVPRCVRQLPQETDDESRKRAARPPSGELVITPTENVNLVEFLVELEKHGYVMVDAYSQHRFNTDKAFRVVRFRFERCEHARPTSFVNIRTLVHQALRTMCEEAMWRMLAFLNPLFVDGQEIGEQGLDIVLTARKPLFEHLGNHVMMQPKGTDGKLLSDTPVPIQPDHVLRFTGDQIQILPAPQAVAI